MFNSHKQIIDQWPTRAEFARSINVDYGRCRQWYDRNRIPAEYWVMVVAACHEKDLPVTFKLLAELIAEKKKPQT